MGIGGLRALQALGHNPTIFHMNEGAFSLPDPGTDFPTLQAGKTYSEAEDQVKRSSIFTTHTPVPAGNDEFPIWLIDKYFSSYWPRLA